jgi:thiamine biosynthesis lipoprotein
MHHGNSKLVLVYAKSGFQVDTRPIYLPDLNLNGGPCHFGNLYRLALAVLIWVGIVGGASTAPCARASETAATKYAYSERHMGVEVRLVLYSADEPTATCAAKAVYARFAQLDHIMSDYRDDSELSRLGATSPHAMPVPISADLFAVLARGQTLAEQTDGAFDVTVGPLVRLWRRARRSGELPSTERLAQAQAATGYRHLKLSTVGNAPHAQLIKPDMRLDLGGIGMGFAVDEGMKLLAKHGINSAMIDASGDIAVSGPPPGSPGWRIGIVPLDVKAPPSRYLWLKHAALATSGDAYQSVEIDGKRYGHIVDPKTGLGLTDRAAVTIVASDCTTADSLATALCILGVDKGLSLAEQLPKVAALFLTESDGKGQTHESAGWGKLTFDKSSTQ